MSASKPRFPLPDSPEANQQGCKCPVPGNGKGEGTVTDGVREFKINPACPLHSDPRAWISRPLPKGSAALMRTLVLALAGGLLLIGPAWAESPPGCEVRPLTVEQVCGTKWGKDERSVTQRMKLDAYARAHIPVPIVNGRPVFPHVTVDGKPRPAYEVDHVCSRELAGGDTPGNLRVQSYFGPCNAHHKDRLENRLHVEACQAGTEAALKAAQRAIAGDGSPTGWVPAYEKRFGSCAAVPAKKRGPAPQA